MELEAFADAVLALALAYPEAWKDHPWGDTVVKVRKKVFVFAGFSDPDRFGISVKLPHSAADVLAWEGAKPTGYGLGKSGWVSLSFPRDAPRDLEAVRALVDESYRAVAPKTLVKQLG